MHDQRRHGAALEDRPSVQVRFKRLDGNADLPLPKYETAGAAAFDLRAAIASGMTETIEPGGRALVETGFAVAIPDGYEMQIRPRSGLALRNGVTVINTPGTIDSDYRGHLCICLVNLGNEPFTFRRGDRVAQAIISPVIHADIQEVEALDETARGAGGFGSTGV